MDADHNSHTTDGKTKVRAGFTKKNYPTPARVKNYVRKK
jgi:hypothetical protein